MLGIFKTIVKIHEPTYVAGKISMNDSGEPPVEICWETVKTTGTMMKFVVTNNASGVKYFDKVSNMLQVPL